ncbi:Xenotropic and polytropic retrovirus receptor 1 [Microbotryomycetes sp. JL201]|nr:Xenotropic and polytropic retrovirus receptor 1 [Microbotryomycetes sp. JL201]
MKFGATLKQHRVEEWRTGYINYRMLKKQIARAAQELDAIDDGQGAEEARLGPSSDVTPARSRDPSAKTSKGTASGENGGASSATARNSSGEDARSQSNGARSVKSLPAGQDRPRAASMPSWKPKGSASIPVPKASSSLRKSTVIDDQGIIVGSPTDSDLSTVIQQSASQPSGFHSTRRNSTASTKSQHSTSSAGLIQRMRSTRIKSATNGLTAAGDFNPRKWRKPFSGDMSLEEVHNLCPPASQRFLDSIEGELDRVAKFYTSREGDAVKRFDELSAQWQELQDHKKEFQAFRAREMQPPQVLNPLFQRMSAIPGSTLVRRTLAHKAPPQHQDTLPYLPREAQGKRNNLVHGRPEEYTSAKAKLKLASESTFEYYRLLGMLKSYRVMNRTGFAKATKKFEKATKIPCSAALSEKLDKSALVTSDKLDELIKETENVFAAAFEHGDRKKALDRLRNFGAQRSHHFTMWRAGLLVGAGVPLLIEGIVQSARQSTRTAIPYWQPLLQLWGSFFLPILFSLFFYVNILSWRRARINYVLIFELDVRNRIDSQQYLEIPALIFFVASLLFWACWSNFWPESISPSSYPLAFFVVAMILLLAPLPLLYPSARWWMFRTFSRLATGGLVRVEFRDFFLGDELNSLYYTIVCFGLFCCAYSHEWPDNTQDICSVNKSWASPVLAALPAGWRLGQSLRRYLDSDGLLIHALNAGKYTASIINFFFYYSWRIYGSPRNWRMGLWILFAVTNSVYTATWDIVMDWSLFRRGSRHYLLRNDLAYFKDSPWAYWIAIVFNIITRFSWVVYLSPDTSLALKGYIVALIEAGRRLVWNSFRVESEHIGNVDGYRATRQIPLPYASATSASTVDGSTEDLLQSDGEDEEFGVKDGTEGARGSGPAGPATLFSRKLARFFNDLKEDLARDFAPLANIHLLVLGKSQDAERRARERKERIKRRKKLIDDSSEEEYAAEGENDINEVDEEVVPAEEERGQTHSSSTEPAQFTAQESRTSNIASDSEDDSDKDEVNDGAVKHALEEANKMMASGSGSL